MTQQFQFWMYTQNNEKQGFKQITYESVFIALFTIAKMYKPPKMSINRWMDNQNMARYICMNVKKLIHATTWMYLENMMLSERSQTQKEKYFMILLVWNKSRDRKERLSKGRDE